MSSDELVGLVSGVKGKLFEIELVDHLNHGHLPDGLHAELATLRPSQLGTSRSSISGNRVVDVLQAKGYRKRALRARSPAPLPRYRRDNDRRVYAQLIAHGTAAHVTNSGISEEVLQQKSRRRFSPGTTSA